MRQQVAGYEVKNTAAMDLSCFGSDSKAQHTQKAPAGKQEGGQMLRV